MNFDWSDYLDLARELARQGAIHSSREAELRSAISRAYYAAFCKSRNYLRDKHHEVLGSGPEVHSQVQDTFVFSKDRRRKQIGENLNRLRTLRNRADYQDQFFKLYETTLVSLGLAEDIISDLKRL